MKSSIGGRGILTVTFTAYSLNSFLIINVIFFFKSCFYIHIFYTFCWLIMFFKAHMFSLNSYLCIFMYNKFLDVKLHSVGKDFVIFFFHEKKNKWKINKDFFLYNFLCNNFFIVLSVYWFYKIFCTCPVCMHCFFTPWLLLFKNTSKFLILMSHVTIMKYRHYIDV